ncbi:hypothetical protein [Micromonospora sp. U21]|uniref:hypothetical protein n=1 Tax=Micromonospora sp. U21 TaxID=2824899 RepID=UPI001B38B18D|nr:hypothetical protein [Micromonospora sp. U21]MBQ0902683.1 hypothetical protein [Micromonospora sp. U21]
MAELETSAGARGMGTFPGEWGMPVGSQFSEARAAWVAARVREHRAMAPLRRRAAEVKRAATDRVVRERQLLMHRER